MQRWNMQQRTLHPVVLLVACTLVLAGGLPSALASPSTPAPAGTYTNPLKPTIPGDGVVENCADPTVIRAQTPGDNYWYMYCTKDPRNDEDRDGNGEYNFPDIPTYRSLDLVNWTFVNTVFSDANFPTWGVRTSALFAPEISFFNDTYYLYYTLLDLQAEASGDTPECGFEPAIGVATSASPSGPWTDLGRPMIEPRRAFERAPDDPDPCNFAYFWTFDAEILNVAGAANDAQRYIYWGSYFGGVFVRTLSTDGFTAPPETQVQLVLGDRAEAPEVVFYNNYYYLLFSSTDCCNGSLTGYSVFAGRSQSPLGPFIDQEGFRLDAGRAGGTPVLSMNGNRWVGTGHNTVFQDFDGQWWTIYHAVDRNDPYLAAVPPFTGTNDEGRLTKRPPMLDPLDWVNGWPTVRGGRWASDMPMPAPAAQPGDTTNYTTGGPVQQDRLGTLIPELSDEFNAPAKGAQWSWVRQPDQSDYAFGENGTFRFNSQAAALYLGSNSASVLTEPTPVGNYVVETKVTFNLPDEGDAGFRKAGLVIYGDDDRYIMLVNGSIVATRQTEYAKETVIPAPPGDRSYGNTVVGPAAATTWLRIVKRTVGREEQYTGYTSTDGVNYVRGGTWTHELGSYARIGLVSMDGPDFIANFDYVRVYRLADYRTWAPIITKP